MAQCAHLCLDAAAAVRRVEIRPDGEARLEAVRALAPRHDRKQRPAVDDEHAAAGRGARLLGSGRRRRRLRGRRRVQRVVNRPERRFSFTVRQEDEREPCGEREARRDENEPEPTTPAFGTTHQPGVAAGAAVELRARRAAVRARRSGSGVRAAPVTPSTTSTAASGPVRQAACTASGRAPCFVHTQ